MDRADALLLPGFAHDASRTAYTDPNNRGYTYPVGQYGATYSRSPPYPLTRTVTLGQHNYGGWQEPTGWTAFFDPIKDASTSRFVVQPANQTIYVPDGAIYFHDIKVKTSHTAQEFTGGAANPGHDATRERLWQTSDVSDDSCYAQSDPGD